MAHMPFKGRDKAHFEVYPASVIAPELRSIPMLCIRYCGCSWAWRWGNHYCVHRETCSYMHLIKSNSITPI